MKERSFSIQSKEHNITVEGGNLWQAKERNEKNGLIALSDSNTTLSVYLQSTDEVLQLRDVLLELVREKSAWHFFLFSLSKRLPSLLFIFPAMITLFVFAFLTVWGDLVIDWAFMNPDEGTIVGLSRRFSLILYAFVAVFILGFFPVFFTGDHDTVAQGLNERFSNRRVVKKRLRRIFNFLKNKGNIKQVIVWNPTFGEAGQDWVQRSFLPALIESKLEIVLQIKIDERNGIEQYLAAQIETESLLWIESYKEHAGQQIKPISMGYLESWEKRLLAVYVFASTANMVAKWKDFDASREGKLHNAVSLRLADFIVNKFKERLFSEADSALLISIDAFAARCINDFGILTPCLQYTNDVWTIADEIVAHELSNIQNDMRFVYTYLQVNIEELSKHLEDPAAALVLNSVHHNTSIYNHDRLEAIRFFVKIIRDSEQYKILKCYWDLLTYEKEDSDKKNNEDIYRILGVPLLIDLATIFEKAAMYEYGYQASEYIETVYPYRGKINKARIAERQGRFADSVAAMLEILEKKDSAEIHLGIESIVDLNLNIAWAVVSGRLETYRELGKKLLSEAEKYLYADFDKIRNSEQIIRLYNVSANFEEWEGRPTGAIANYEKAMQIPGVSQAQLSNLFVNRGIALRQTKQLNEAVFYGTQGAEIKLAIGDADQAPIALHNLAQTILMLAYSKAEDEDFEVYCKKAAHYAKIGLDIQEKTGSVKKRGQLLLEYFIGIYGSKSVAEDKIRIAWDNVKTWVKAEILAGRENTYDCKVVAQELMSLLTGNSNAILQDLLAWNPEWNLKKTEKEGGDSNNIL